MRGGVVARRYARALYGLGVERGSPEELAAELDTLGDEIQDSPELEKVLFTPIHPRAERRGVMSAVCEGLDISEWVRAFTLLLIDENRASALPAIREALREIVEREAGRVEVEVTSARPLTGGEVEKLRAAISERVGCDVMLELKVDDGLIGGVVARVGDLLLDGSVRSQLANLRGSLRRESA